MYCEPLDLIVVVPEVNRQEEENEPERNRYSDATGVFDGNSKESQPGCGDESFQDSTCFHGFGFWKLECGTALFLYRLSGALLGSIPAVRRSPAQSTDRDGLDP